MDDTAIATLALDIIAQAAKGYERHEPWMHKGVLTSLLTCMYCRGDDKGQRGIVAHNPGCLAIRAREFLAKIGE